MSSLDDFKNGNGKVSISSFGEANTISQLDSLEVILKDSKGNDLTKATLNELGHFLKGTKENTISDKFTKELTSEKAVKHYQGLINEEDNGVTYASLVKESKDDNEENLKIGDVIFVTSDGDISNINTNLFKVRNEASNGAEAKVKSAWDFDKTTQEDLDNVAYATVKYTVNDKTYEVKVTR